MMVMTHRCSDCRAHPELNAQPLLGKENGNTYDDGYILLWYILFYYVYSGRITFFMLSNDVTVIKSLIA